MAHPEHLAEAAKYGARDCAYCHVRAEGGTGLNERGGWLLAEKERRGAEAVDAAWLAVRETEVDLPERAQEAVHATLPAATTQDSDRSRAVDYSTDHGDWPAYGGDLGARKYSPLGEIDARNVDRLAVAWVWEAFDSERYQSRGGRGWSGGMRATPVVAGGRLFVRTAFSAVAALDPATGEVLWTFDPGTGAGPRPPMFGFATRGLAYWHGDGNARARVLLVTTDGWLIALDAASGEPVPDFGADGRVDLSEGLRRRVERSGTTWSNAPTVCRDVVVVGSQNEDGSHRRDGWQDNVPLGDVRGFDVRTGRTRWVFKTVPQQGEFGNDSWGDESWRWMGNTNVWSTTSCDAELGHVYLPVSAPTDHFYGGLRPGDNLFGTSVVAVDVDSGERQWHFQTVHHDIWDYDLPAAPVVADIEVGGRPVQALAQVSKVGFLYVFDRTTGEPLWPIEERPVPASDLDGEHTSPTQPFPTWPPPFELQGATEDDVIDFTEELRERALKRFRQLKTGGLFLPPSEQGSLVVPGWGGGANWGGAAFDPETDMLYVASRRSPLILTARRVDAERRGYRYAVAPRDIGRSSEALPMLKPPWSSITAYHLGSGDIVWQRANGRGPVDHPDLKGLELPDLGARGRAPGLLVTRHFLFYGHGRWDRSELRAADKATGEVVWRHPLQGTHLTAPPMTYAAGGRQHVVVATGMGAEPGRLTAFRLP